MWLILCSSGDLSAFWTYEGLKTRGLAPLELVTAETLAYAHWEHRLGIEGVHSNMTLPDGRRIHNKDVRGVLNRLTCVPYESLLLIHPSDREYVLQELNAFFLAWLESLPRPMLNSPTPQGLSGYARHVSEWIWLASKAGLPTLNYGQSSHNFALETSANAKVFPIGTPIETVIVINGHVTGSPTPAYIQNGCRHLAELSNTELLGIEFSTSMADSWTFAGATTFPDLRLGGQALLDVLISVLNSEQDKKE